jgi:hypothetical protein
VPARRDVVEAGKRDVGGNAHAQRAQRRQPADGHLVVAEDDGTWPTATSTEHGVHGSLTARLGESPVRIGRIGNLQARRGQRLTEPDEALDRVGRLRRAADEREIAIAMDLDEVLGDLPCAPAVVGADEVEPARSRAGRQHDDRHAARDVGEVAVGQAARHHHQAVDLSGDGQREVVARRIARGGDEHGVADGGGRALGTADNLVDEQRRLVLGVARLVEVGEQQADDARAPDGQAPGRATRHPPQFARSRQDALTRCHGEPGAVTHHARDGCRRNAATTGNLVDRGAIGHVEPPRLWWLSGYSDQPVTSTNH